MGRHESRHLDRHDRRWNWALILGGLGFLAVFLYVSASIPTPAEVAARNLEPAEVVETGRDVRLAASLFNDGRARFYRYVTAAGREVRFFVMRTPDGVIRAAFDACEACFRSRKGYRQSGDKMICNGCGGGMRSVDINVSSVRCIPGTLEHAIEGDRVVITAAAIERGISYF